MPYNLRDPIGPVETGLLRQAVRALAEVHASIRFANFRLPTSTSLWVEENPPGRDDAPTYTIDRSPVGTVDESPVLVVTVGKKPVLLISPDHMKIVAQDDPT